MTSDEIPAKLDRASPAETIVAAMRRNTANKERDTTMQKIGVFVAGAETTSPAVDVHAVAEAAKNVQASYTPRIISICAPVGQQKIRDAIAGPA